MTSLFKKVLLLFTVLCIALVFGCAKQPVTDDTATTGAGTTGGSGQDGTFSSQKVTDDSAAADVPASLQRVFFSFDSYVLTADTKATLEDNAAYLKANSNVRVQIEGHCDERGSDEYNLVLGEKRARATKAYLETLGINARRISVISYGEERPLDPSSGETAWSKNRRAEFVSR